MQASHHENEISSRKEAQRLPASLAKLPEVEILKQIIGQMMENERRRVRSEYLRISSIFLVILALVFGAGAWLFTDVLRQLRAERKVVERSWTQLLERTSVLVSAAPPAAVQAAVIAWETEQPQLPPAKDDNGNVALTRMVMNLEAKNRALIELLKKQQDFGRAMFANAPSTGSWKIRKSQAFLPDGQADKIASKSFIVPVRRDLPLRVSIPAP